MMFFGTDSGPDHNVTSILVMLSYIYIFIELDLDFLGAARTPPNFSVVNPAERFMSVANIALVGVSLSRNNLGADEKKVKSFTSKKLWRDAHQKRPDIDYPQLALDGTKDARKLLSDRFERLTYKGEQVQIGEPVTEEEISELKLKISALFDIDFSAALLKAKVLKVPAVEEFFADHVRCTKYTFQVKKCKKD
ncbi:uncharacterized protein LOC119771239 [Culex quinquefasciatus]|uniref:uncharacterized protein LOC119771239 n=1 Tax=Culex quinquefasciatus TaxID=7176 RepID=UPI0018E373F1|nr:uncharacterized protein LOC119771239 [Culex quinquefasciatus]